MFQSAPFITPGPHEMMVAIGVFGNEDFACRLPGAKIIDGENMHVIINLLLTILYKATGSHDAGDSSSIGGQIHIPVGIYEMYIIIRA